MYYLYIYNCTFLMMYYLYVRRFIFLIRVKVPFTKLKYYSS